MLFTYVCFDDGGYYRKLYQGNASHASNDVAFQHLGITHVVNITVEHPNWLEVLLVLLLCCYLRNMNK